MPDRRPSAERAGVERLTRGLAALAALTTIPGLIGWVIRAPQLVQPVHAFAPGRPWSFLVILAASVAVGATRARVVHTAAALTVLCAVIGLGAHVLAVPLPLDAYVTGRVPSIDPLQPTFGIALSTGLLYTAIAIMAWLSRRQSVPTAAREREAMLVSAVSAVVVTLAGVLWVARLLGVLESVPAREWLQSPIQSLAAAMVLGLALLQRSVSASRMSLAPPSWAPAVAGIGSGLLVLLLWRGLVIREEMQLAARSQIASDAVQRAIERQVSVIQASIDRVARFVRVAPTSLATLQSTVPPLVAETDGLGRMLLLDSTGLLRRVIPADPRAVVTAELRAALTRVHARATPRQRETSGLDNSQDVVGLGDSPWGIAIIHPVGADQGDVAFAVGLLDERDLLASFTGDTSAGFVVRAFVGDSQLVGAPMGTASRRAAPTRVTEMRLGSRVIRLTLTPQRAAALSTLPDLVLMLGLAIAALIALVLWLARRTFEQASAVGMTRMQRAIERATDGVWELDLLNGRVHRSEALLKNLGLDPAEINGPEGAWNERVHPDDAPVVAAALQRHLSGAADVFECEYRVRAHDGGWHTLVDRGRLIDRTLDGRPLRLLGITADTTERGRVEGAREESERRFRAMFETAYQLQLLLDLDGCILEANRAAAELANTRAETLQGQRFADLPWWPDDGVTAQRVQDRVSRARNGETSRFEVTLTAADDRAVIVDVSLKPILDQDAQVVQVLAEGRDITERKRAEISLREIGALTTMGRLAARVAHEINNPLAGIQNSFLLVRDSIPVDSPHYRFVGAIEREIARIAAVTRQLYETYRPDQATETNSSVIIAISDAVTFLEQVNRARQVTITTDVVNAPSLVPVPDALLRQALYNLVQNALDASPTGGTIIVSAARDGDWCLIRVSDEGPGIPASVRERIFDPFFSTKDRTVKTGGMGIGLSLVRQSVVAVGGEIEVQDRPGGGTTFAIRLPMIPIDTGVLR